MAVFLSGVALGAFALAILFLVAINLSQSRR
jgi:hypothetical protein